MTKRIIVLGAERSGTSVLTEMIHLWGAYAGEPEKLTPADEHNPRGQWEYEPLWDLLAEIGDFAAGETWWDAAFEERITAKLADEQLTNKARALVAHMEREGEPWVWKDPALCHFLSFWEPIWGDVTYVIAVRHPYDVARSWQRMIVPSSLQTSVDLIRCNLLRWQHMMLQVLRATNEAKSKIFVEYESLVRDPVAQARRIAAFLGDEAAVQTMASAVERSYRRHRFDRSLADISEATNSQHRLYEFLLRKVEDPDAPFVDDYPMPEDWWTYVRSAEEGLRDRLFAAIRPFDETDTDTVVDLWHRAGLAEYTYIPTWQVFTLEKARTVFLEHVVPKCDIWVAAPNGVVVAYLAMDGCYIDRLYVDPDHQRQGWGTALLEHAKRLSPDGLELDTHQQNVGARALYERHGFVPVHFGVSPAPESIPDVEYHWRPVSLASRPSGSAASRAESEPGR